MTTSGGLAQPVAVDTTAVQTGGPALPVAVQPAGSPSRGGPAALVYVVTSGPVQGGPAVPIVAAAAGAVVAAGPALPIYVMSGSFTLPVDPTYLLRDEFTSTDAAPIASPRTSEPGPGTLTANDTDNRLSIANARLVAASGSGSWDDPSEWSAALDSSLFGAVAALYRIKGASITGLALILHSAANVNPTSAGMGLYYARPDLKGNRLSGSSGALSKPSTRVRSIDYLFAVVRRSGGGAFVAVSGGVYGTFPTAALLWTDDTDSIGASAYAGMSGNDGGWSADFIHAIKASVLPAALTTRFGAATDYDTFTRANAPSLGASEGLGTTWTLSAGSGSITNGKALITHTADVLATITMPSAPKIIEAKITTPASGGVWMGIAFRSGGGFWILFEFNTAGAKWAIEERPGGATPGQGAFAISNNQTYRLRVIDYGTGVRCFIDDVDMSGFVATTWNAGQTGVGWQRAPTIDNGSLVDDFAAWPATITLPTELGPFPTPPVGSGAALVSDAFTAADGTALSTYNAAWSTAGAGSWQINTNKARISAAATAGYAFRSTSTAGANHEVSASVTVPNTTPTYPTDWYCGVIARYTDTNNYIGARFIYQNNNPEVELVEMIGGSESVIEAVLLIGTVAPNGTYTLALAVNGNEAAVYVNGEIVLQSRVSFTTGSNAGMFVDAGVALSGQPTWDDFTVKAT